MCFKIYYGPPFTTSEGANGPPFFELKPINNQKLWPTLKDHHSVTPSTGSVEFECNLKNDSGSDHRLLDGGVPPPPANHLR